jgi:hypothetical protein
MATDGHFVFEAVSSEVFVIKKQTDSSGNKANGRNVPISLPYVRQLFSYGMRMSCLEISLAL